MSRNLYETLGISRDATSEDVRRAYRRKALETHPDRLPQGASAAEKAVSEDLFRRVNNAYEVLSDPQSRTAYDQHGVWPPPTSQQVPFANGPNDPFSNTFFRDPFSNHPFFRASRTEPFGGSGFTSGFGFTPFSRAGSFTDPFVLFNSIFGDLHRAFESDPFFDDPFARRGFGSTPFPGGFLSMGYPSAMSSPFDNFGSGRTGNSRVQAFSGGSGGNGGQWISQSWSSSTVNGVTHTKSVHRDSQGNEHVLYRYPNGTERRTVNGIEQSSGAQTQRALPAPSVHPPPAVSYPTQGDYAPPPPPYAEAVAQPPYRSRSSRHVHYDDQSGDRHRDRHGHGHSSYEKDRERDREYGYDYRDDGRGHDAQSGSKSNWQQWRS